MAIKFLQGDSFKQLSRLPSNSVHCCITSPPYWRLRDYSIAGQIGQESTREAHIAALVAVFREVHRVLRTDGTLWLNYGDCYINKQLQGMAWRLALAMQAEGWILRSDIIWVKPSCMPESVTDRPTKAHEYIFLFSKSRRYYYDAESIKEPLADDTIARLQRGVSTSHKYSKGAPGQSIQTVNKSRINSRKWERTDGSIQVQQGFKGHSGYQLANKQSVMRDIRNRRSVWVISSRPFTAKKYGINDIDHYATFSPAIPEICIKAGTSSFGCCSRCGAPLQRKTTKTFIPQPDVSKESGIRGIGPKVYRNNNPWENSQRGTTRITTIGWQPTCQHRSSIVPAVVLDPFGGSGTTGLVANQLGRDAVLIELNPAYVTIAKRRIEKESLVTLAAT